MKILKIFRKMISRGLLLLSVLWLVSIIIVEINSVIFKKEFKNGYKQTHMIAGKPVAKVLTISPKKATIYYVDEEGGNVITFVYIDESGWKMDEWKETVWSASGSADGFVWPYIFDNLYYNSFLYKNME